jgi:hypothetical protein
MQVVSFAGLDCLEIKIVHNSLSNLYGMISSDFELNLSYQ